MQLDITKIAQDLLEKLEADHLARKEGVILLHNLLISEIERLQAEAVPATAPEAAETAAGV